MSAQTPSPRIEAPSALPAGARLGEFELLSVLGIGGFGIVYLAFDHALEREVAVKEYMPASLAGRTETMHVSLRSQSDAETFALGLRSFVNEARLLARFDHPSLLKVHRFWEANGTAYMAMPVLRGRTLKDVRQAMTQPPNEAWLRSLLGPLLGAIERLHSEGVYHRDIAPDNIQIEPDGRPVLLDFGAARRVISDKSQALTAILKPAYAPIEQYGEAGSVRQGPWTDFYALGATLHYLLMGRPPAPATARAVHDEPSALTAERLPGCSEGFLHIVDWMLAPRPAERPQSVAQLRAALEDNAVPGREAAARRPAAIDLDETVLLASPSLDITIDGIDAEAGAATPGTAQPAQAGASRAPVAQPTLRPLVGAAGAAAATAATAPQPSLRSAPAARSNWLPAIAAVAVVGVLLAVGAALWPRATNPDANSAQVGTQAVLQGASPTTPPEPAATAAPAPALATVAAPVASAAIDSAATSPSAAMAEPPAAQAAGQSAPVAKPVLPAAESTVATVVAQPPKPAPAVPTRPAAASTKPPSGAAKPAAVESTPRLVETARADRSPPANARPAPPPRVEAPTAAPPTVDPDAGASPAAAAAADAAKAAARSPEERCAGRNPFMYFVCMERACLRSEFVEHADCRRWRKEAQRD